MGEQKSIHRRSLVGNGFVWPLCLGPVSIQLGFVGVEAALLVEEAQIPSLTEVRSSILNFGVLHQPKNQLVLKGC